MKVKRLVKKAFLIVLSVILIISVSLPVMAGAVKLNDTAGNQYEKTIQKWVDIGYIKGNPDGTFKPNNPITRAEFMALVNRSFKMTGTTEPKFNDVKKTDWFYEEVTKAVKAGYMLGSNGKIYPKNNISRQEIAIIAARLGKLDTKQDAAVLNKMKDIKSIPEWSKGAISAALSIKLFEGFVTTEFKATQNISRVEAVVVLDRLLAYLNASIDLPEEEVAGGAAIIPPATSSTPTATPTPGTGGGGGSVGGGTNIAVQAITVTPTTMTLTVGGATGTITKTISPANATNQNVTWSSSNVTVATVSNGVVTAKATGTATITVRTTDGNKTAACQVTVVKPILSINDIRVINATSVTFRSNSAPTTVTWNGKEATVTSYDAATKLATITVPLITATANDLVVNAAGYSLARIHIIIAVGIYGNLKVMNSSEQLDATITTQADGEVWILLAGDYAVESKYRFDIESARGDVGYNRYYFPIKANNLKIIGEGNPVIYGSTLTLNGVRATQNFITVMADGVTIDGVTIMSKLAPNKAIEVAGDRGGKNFTLKNSKVTKNTKVAYHDEDVSDYFGKIEKLTSDDIYFPGSVYFYQNVGNSVVENVVIEKGRISAGSINGGASVALKDVIVDYTGSVEAKYENIYVVISTASRTANVTSKNVTVKVDNTATHKLQEIVNNVPLGTTVEFAAGTYYNSTGAAPTAPSGVTLITTGAIFVKADKIIGSIAELKDAISTQADGQTWLIKGGIYDIPADTTTFRDNNGAIVSAGGQPGWYMPITANNLTIIGVNNPKITSSFVTPNGSWASQTLIAVWGDNVTLRGLTITPKLEVNKSIEVVGNKKFTIEDCTFTPNTIAAGAVDTKGGSLYFNGTGATGTKAILIRNNTFNYTTVAFDGVEGSDITITGNTFEHIADGAYAVGNTYWGSADRKTTQYADVKVNGNNFNNVTDSKKIIAARLNQTFRLDAANKINSAAINKNDFSKYINFNNLAYWSECKKNEVVVDGVTYVSPYKDVYAYVTNAAQLIAAVNNAPEGSTILVAAGTYNESIEITKPIKLIGAGADKTVLNASNGSSWYTISLGRAGNYGDDLSGTIIEGFTINAPTINEGDKAPIYLTAQGSADNKIIVRNNKFVGQPRTAVQQGIGILTPYNDNIGNIDITNNQFNTLKYAMYFNSIRDALVSGNTIDDTKYACIVIAGDTAIKSSNVNITNNTLTNISWRPISEYNDPTYDSGICIGSNVENITVSGNSITMLNGKLETYFANTVSKASSEAEFNAALTNPDISTIIITESFTTAGKININRPIVINGRGKIITVSQDLGTDNSSKHALGIQAKDVTIKDLTIDSASKAYGIQAYGDAFVTLVNITITNSKGAGLTVNGSTIVANTLNTSGNAWGGVNVDPGSGVNTPSVFTLNGGTLGENIQIWSDGEHITESARVTVTAAGYNQITYTPNYTGAGPDSGKIWTNKSILVNNITVTSFGGATTVVNGETLLMSALVSPSYATDKTVTWTVETLAGGKATIDAVSGLLTAEGVGTVTVKATAKDVSALEGTLVITITAAPMKAAEPQETVAPQEQQY